MGATCSGINKKSFIKLSMLIEYFHTQSLQNTIHIYLIYKTKSLHIFIFHKPCMICLYKKLKRIPLKNSGMICTLLKKTCLSLIKIGRIQFLQHNLTETTTCDPWEKGKRIQGLKNQICTTEYFEAYCQLYLPSKNMS